MGRLDGKVALIIGGAGSIGSATARLMIAEGASVVVSDVVEADVEGALFVETDVTDSAAVRAAVEVAVAHFGGFDVAFANAGVFGVVAPVTDYPEDEFARVAVNGWSARSCSPSTRCG
jgi:NAD(P)-dependent dehydrogenase (short-subunit alcohol dehydrogenase family)